MNVRIKFIVCMVGALEKTYETEFISVAEPHNFMCGNGGSGFDPSKFFLQKPKLTYTVRKDGAFFASNNLWRWALLTMG
jgi:hypothetical protein